MKRGFRAIITTLALLLTALPSHAFTLPAASRLCALSALRCETPSTLPPAPCSMLLAPRSLLPALNGNPILFLDALGLCGESFGSRAWNGIKTGAGYAINGIGYVLSLPEAGLNAIGIDSYDIMNIAVNTPIPLDDLAAATFEGVSYAAASMRTFRFASKAARVGRGATKTGGGGLNLYRKGAPSTKTSQGWKTGDRMLNLPNKGSPKANWNQNSGFLRQEMSKGRPIFDSYRNPGTGAQIPSGQTPTSSGRFLNAERQLLETRGWKYNPQTGAYHPPIN